MVKSSTILGCFFFFCYYFVNYFWREKQRSKGILGRGGRGVTYRSAGTVVDGHRGSREITEALLVIKNNGGEKLEAKRKSVKEKEKTNVSSNKESLTTLDVTKGRTELLKSGTYCKREEEKKKKTRRVSVV